MQTAGDLAGASSLVLCPHALLCRPASTHTDTVAPAEGHAECPHRHQLRQQGIRADQRRGSAAARHTQRDATRPLRDMEWWLKSFEPGSSPAQAGSKTPRLKSLRLKSGSSPLWPGLEPAQVRLKSASSGTQKAVGSS